MTSHAATHAEDGVLDGERLPVTRSVLVPAGRDTGALTVAPKQAAALAATGFVAGMATVAVVARKLPGAKRRRRRRNGVLGEVLSTNSFLVDVHLVRRS